jgi:uncharacterized membrane protein
MEATADAMASVAPEVRKHFAAARSEVGARMLEAWQAGIRDSLGLVRGLTRAQGPMPSAKRKLAKSDEKLLAYLRQTGGSASDTLAAIAGELRMPESTLSASLNRLVERGLVRRSGRKVALIRREV